MSFAATSRYRYSTFIHAGTDVYFGPRPRYTTDLASDDGYYTVRVDDDLTRIAASTLGDARYWWVLADFNSILDPLSPLPVGAELRVPSRRRLFMEVLR